MFNLFVSGDCEAWKSKIYSLDTTRVIRSSEYTSEEIALRFENLTEDVVEQLKVLPCLFAYEDRCGQAPRFGWIKSVKVRSGKVIVDCEYVEIDPWITAEQLRSRQSVFDITGWELSRTHWAVKDVNLQEEMEAQFGISIPSLRRIKQPSVDPEKHLFEVAFSFPGETRSFIEKVVEELEKRINPNDIFYDNNFKAFLARPNLDAYLAKIYRENSKMIVVFLSADYQKKLWTGLEFRTIREIIFNKDYHKVMYIRMDDSPVDGVLQTDGFIDVRQHSASEIAAFIYQRVKSHI